MLAAVARWSIRRPVLVVVLWLAAVADAFTVGVGVFDRLVSDVGRVPGSESDRAYSLIAEAGPQPVVLTAVVESPDPALRSAVGAAVTDLRAAPGVLSVADPVPSTATGRAVLLRIELAPGPGADTAPQDVAERLRRIDVGTVIVAGGSLTDNEFNA